MKITILFLGITILFFSCIKIDVSPTVDFNAQGSGKSANDILSANKFTALNLQIQYMPGFKPPPTTINDVTTYLNNLCNKPGGITFTLSPIIHNHKDSLTLDEVKTIEKSNRVTYTKDNILDVYVLITDSYDVDSRVGGEAYLNTSLVIFGKGFYFGYLDSAGLTTALEHELGHLMGLVNRGSAMKTPHADPTHSDHCDNPNCLMYWNANYAILPKLDNNCLNDLRANGGK